MLYPAELQALPQPRGLRLAQDFNLCLASQAAEEDCYLVQLVCLVCLVKQDQADKQNKPDQPNKRDSLACLTLAGYKPVRQEYFFSCRSGVLAKRVQ
jgi:hypothetical protein